MMKLKNRGENNIFHNEYVFNTLKKNLEQQQQPISKNSPDKKISDNSQLTATKTIIFNELENYKEKTQRKIEEMQIH